MFRTRPPGSPSPELSVLVVSYNTVDETVACLRSVIEETHGVEYEIIVVDNASTDGSADAIEAVDPSIRLVRSAENLGFGAANNLASKMARGRLLLLLNPDTLLRMDALTRLVSFSHSHPRARLWGGRTVALDGTLNIGSCWGAPTLWGLFCRAIGLSSVFKGSSFFNREAMGGWKRDTIREVDIVSGCFLMIERELWEDLAGFHRDFFMYGEDIDLSLRARRLGAAPRICPQAEIVHLEGASERVKSAKLVRLFTSRMKLYRKFWSPLKASCGLGLVELRVLVRVASDAVRSPFRRGDARKSEWAEVWRQREVWREAFRTTERYGAFEPGAWGRLEADEFAVETRSG
ncbi:MAG: glycosyltransferase family 2 protein [Planctomycetota bacterium]